MNSKRNIDSSWNPVLNKLYQEPLVDLLNILPDISFQPQGKDIFNALSMATKDIKVVILGTEPYSSPNCSLGYAFRVPLGKLNSFELKVINREVNAQFPSRDQFETDLSLWKDQGVLLLNTALTVETGRPGSHLTYWREFTQAIVSLISHKNPCIWLLWGKNAQSFIPYIHNQFQVRGYDEETIKKVPINEDFNYVLTSTNPALNPANFYGNNHFIFANEILSKTKNTKILW